MKSKIIKVLCLCLAVVLLLPCFISCGEDEGAIAMEYISPNDKVTGKINQNLMSFIIAVINYQYSGLEDYYDMVIGEGVNTTIADMIIAEATAYGKMLLQAEYLNDYVYGYSLTEEQTDNIENYMESLVSYYGSEAGLADMLSTYGTDKKALERFLTLTVKQSTLKNLLYASGGAREISENQLINYFAENYVIADHVLIKLTGEVKEDGTATPLTAEEKQQKRDAAATILNEINSGAISFDDAVTKYGEDTYKTIYKNGYFLPLNGSSAIDSEVLLAVRAMAEGEIKTVESENGIYIIRKNKMDPELCLEVEDFAYALYSAVLNADFQAQMATADGVKIHSDIIKELDPATIPGFDIDSIFGDDSSDQ